MKLHSDSNDDHKWPDSDELLESQLDREARAFRVVVILIGGLVTIAIAIWWLTA